MPESQNLLVFLIAIPFFVISIIGEWWQSTRRENKLYGLADTLTNLHLGSGQLLVGLLIKAPLLGLYYMIFQWSTSLGVPSWSTESWITWVCGFILMDFFYYWFHRLSHEINFLWAAHAVHHQSEYYNLSVALRQSWIQQIFSGLFYLPLALFGIPVEMFFLLNALNTLSQFWIHTQLIDRLGHLELIFNTPSHHRVHHGVDDDYVDKNYAGFFIIWDRMFGTFTQETTAPRYGVIKPLRSWSPLWANLDVWHLMLKRICRGTLNIFECLTIFFRAPAWQGKRETPLAITLRTDSSYQLFQAQGGLWRYGVIMGVSDILLSSYLVAIAPQRDQFQVMGGVIFILLSATIHSACIEGKTWARFGAWIRIGIGVSLLWGIRIGFVTLFNTQETMIIWGILQIGAALLLTWSTRSISNTQLTH